MNWNLALMPGLGALGCVVAGVAELSFRLAPDLRYLRETDRPRWRAWVPYLVFEATLGALLVLPPLQWWPMQLDGWGWWVLPAAFFLAPATARARAATVKVNGKHIPIGPGLFYSAVRRELRDRLVSWHTDAMRQWTTRRQMIAQDQLRYPSGRYIRKAFEDQATDDGCLEVPRVIDALAQMDLAIDRKGPGRTKDVVFSEVIAAIPGARVPGMAERIDTILYAADQAPGEKTTERLVLRWTRLGAAAGLVMVPIVLVTLLVSVWDPAGSAGNGTPVTLSASAVDPSPDGGKVSVVARVNGTAFSDPTDVECAVDWSTKLAKGNAAAPPRGDLGDPRTLSPSGRLDVEQTIDLSGLDRVVGTVTFSLVARCESTDSEETKSRVDLFLIDPREWTAIKMGD